MRGRELRYVGVGRPVCMAHHATCLGFWSGLALVTWGCGAGGASATAEPAVTDSAGVTIVSNPASRESTTPLWTVGPEPGLRIGSAEGDPQYQLWRVRGVLDLSGRRIAVGNEGSAEVRIYSAHGEHLASLGGRGEGPGEFQDLALVGVLGEDTLVVLDESLGRITFLHPDLGLLRTVAVSGDVSMRLTPRGMFDDGTLVVGGGFVFPPNPDDLRDGYTRGWTEYRALGADGLAAADLGEFPGLEAYLTVSRSAAGAGVHNTVVLFGKYPMAAVAPGRFYYASGDAYQVQVMDPSGALRRIIRLDRPPSPVTSADVEAYVAWEVAQSSEEGAAQRIRARYRENPPSETFPAMGGLSVDALGNLWVQEYRKPMDPPGTPVLVFDTLGVLVARTELPEGLGLRAIGPDFILGVRWDDFGTESVVRHHLQRRGG